MRYSAITQALKTILKTTNQLTALTMGRPGGGKSWMNREVAFWLISEVYGEKVVVYNDADPATWEKANYVEFNASLRDPVDVMGTPRNDNEVTRWKAPGEFYAFRKGAPGRVKVLNLEEVSDASVPMQNALCGVIYDRRAGNTLLHENMFILASGNRTEDKSGANRLTSKFSNRCIFFDFDENIDDWTDWALRSSVDPRLIQFLRFRPNLLSDFDPNRRCNPTPRTWAWVNLIPATLPTDIFYGSVEGLVGPGAAAEYTGYLKVYMNLPDMDDIEKNPLKVKVPTDPATRYALTGAIAHRMNRQNIAPYMQYIDRMPPEFQVMCVKDALHLCPEIKKTKEFVQFTTKNVNLMLG